MKNFRNILSIILVITIFNVVVGKSVHEFFEHHTKIHACINKNTTHFHELEIDHIDFICDFNFSSNSFLGIDFPVKKIICYQQNEFWVQLFWFIKNYRLNNLSLRGPPLY